MNQHTQKIVAEELLREQELREEAFRSAIRKQLGAIATLTRAINSQQKLLNEAKANLKKMSLESLDTSIFY